MEFIVHVLIFENLYMILKNMYVATPLLEECEDGTHTLKMGTWEFAKTPETSEFDFRGQNTSFWNVLHVIRKLLKRRCWKWPCMSHLDIYSTSYGKKKGQESNCQFDSWPLKVKNRSDTDACKCSATNRWKALKERYKFSLNLISIRGLSLGSPNRDNFGTPPWES